MEAVSSLVKVSLPNYLRNLPIPSSLSGFAQLTGQDWLTLLPFVGGVSLLVYVTVNHFLPKGEESAEPVCNPYIMKESAKVVNAVDIEDIGQKACYCRCWRSKKFPLCDGSHNKHNELTGDNVGPIVVKRREENK